VIAASGLQLRAGAQLLLEGASFQIGPGDKVGLVGRNGAGKTTLARVLAGEALPATGTVRRSEAIGYLPQDTRAGDLDGLALDRVLSGRGLDELRAGMRAAEQQMSDAVPGRRDAAVRRYGQLEERLAMLGGYAAEAEASSIASSLGLPDRVLAQPLATLSGGQRRRVELARILFADAQTLLLDEPTNHLDADSVAWLRDHLRAFRGGLVVISHDTALLDSVVTKVFHLDADTHQLDIYNVGWQAYLEQRETDARRRRRENANASRQAAALQAQADKMRAKATKARAAQGMQRRAERLLAGMTAERAPQRVARLRFPDPAPCGRVPLSAAGLSKSYGSLEVFTDVSLAVDRGARIVVLGLNGAGKTTLLRLLAGLEKPDTGEVIPGHGLRLGYYAQEH
jgi:ATPase subunit of ABC transporter with duplicated ATPase domains